MVVGAGAALAYFLDPVSGRERREQLRQAWNERSKGGLTRAWPDPAPPPAAEPGPTVVVPESSKGRSSEPLKR
jgi:hypothetical protein